MTCRLSPINDDCDCVECTPPVLACAEELEVAQEVIDGVREKLQFHAKDAAKEGDEVTHEVLQEADAVLMKYARSIGMKGEQPG